MTNEQRVAHEAEKERRRKDYKLRDLRYKSPAEGERKSPRKSRVWIQLISDHEQTVLEFQKKIVFKLDRS